MAVEFSAEDKRKLRTGMLPTQKTLDTAPKAPVGQAPPLELPTGAVTAPARAGVSLGASAGRSYAANTDPTPFVPTRENLGGGGGFAGARMSQADVEAQARQALPNKVVITPPQRPVETPATNEAGGGAAATPSMATPAAQNTAAPATTTPTTQPATDPAVGWEEREAQIRNRGIRGGQGFGGARTDSAPAPNDYAFLGNSGLGRFNRELLMAKDRVRAERNAADVNLKQIDAESQLQSDIFKERMAGERNQMALDREDARQAAIGEREQARLDFDRDKEMDAQTRRLFETEVDGQKSFDNEGFLELKEYMTATGERDPYKARVEMQTGMADRAMKMRESYQTPEAAMEFIEAQQDPATKAQLMKIFAQAFPTPAKK